MMHPLPARSTRYLLLTVLALLGLVGSALAAVGLSAHQAAVERGVPPTLPQPVAGSAVSPFGINAALEQYGDAQLDWALDTIAGGGFRWVRQRFAWSAVQPAPGRWDWSTWDAIVDGAAARDLQLIAVLDGAPAWAGLPPDPAAFAAFAAAFAQRYGDRVDCYQLWHNPNLAAHWGSPADPVSYAALLHAAAPAIRTADPGARVLLGSLAPTVETGPDNLSEVLFLRGLYDAGARDDFDVVSVQPYGFDLPPDDRRVLPGLLNFSRAIRVREEMEAQGDGGKAVWASHFGWNSLPPGWQDVPSFWGQVDEQTQAAYTAAAVERARLEWPWMGVLCLQGFQPRPAAEAAADTAPTASQPVPAAPDADEHWGFAAIAPDGTPRPVFTALQALALAPATNYPGAYTPLDGAAEWSGDWRFSAQGADVSEAGGERVRIPFVGTDFGLRVRRGNYRAHFYVTIDGRPAPGLPQDERGAYLILTHPDYVPSVDLIPVAQSLSDGPHVAEIVPERGWSQWPLAGWSVGRPTPTAVYRASLAAFAAVALACAVAALAAGRRVHWGRLGGRVVAAYGKLSQGAQMALTLAVTALLWLSAWLTWGDWLSGAFRRLGDGTGIAATLAAAALFYYSPWFLLTLAGGAALAALILLRLDLGLALVAALAPFYMQPRPLMDKAFSMVELVTLLCLLSWGLRQAGGWRRTVSDMDGHRWTWIGERLRVRLQSSVSRLRSLDWAAIFFVGVSVASIFVANHRHEALRELRIVVIEPALFYLMLRTTRLDRRQVWRLVDFFVLGALGVALIGLFQYAFNVNLITAEEGFRRVRSVYGSPNGVGLYLGRVLPLLVACLLFGKQRRRRLAYGLALLPVGAALLLSFSKGALLIGVPASLLALGLIAGGPWLWASLATLGAGAVAAVPLLRTPRFASLLDTRGGTTFFRIKLWQSAWHMLRDHPVLGVGLDNFLYEYRGHYILPDAWQEPNLADPHNWLLGYAVRLGLLGVAAALWFQVAFWRAAWPLRRLADPDGRALALGLMGSMVYVLGHGLVDMGYFFVDLAFVFFLTLGLVTWLRENRSESKSEIEEGT